MSNLDKLEQSFANKHQKYWASMRTNLSLINRSEKYSENKIDQLRNELSDILESGILNYPQTLSQAKITPDMALKEKKELLGLRTIPLVRSVEEQKFLDDMAHKAYTTRQANWSWRIGEESEERQKEGWYPFFVTLTIDPLLCNGKERWVDYRKFPAYDSPKQLWQDGREFRNYIRDLADMVAHQMGHNAPRKKPYKPESDYVRYCGVIEHGKSREHHHGHFLIWLRDIPPSWRTCPNAGIRNPAKRKNRECFPLRTFWQWSLPGLSPALYFRSVGDIWETKYNHVLPIDRKTGQAITVGTARQTGGYITKYLSKEHKEWKHRMKATRNLGMQRLKHVMKMLDPKIVEALTWRAENANLNTSLMRTHGVPLGMLRLEAKRQNYLIRFRSRQLTLTELLLNNSVVFNRMLTSVKDGARPDRMDSSAFFDWVGNCLPVQRGYCKERLIAAHCEMARYFPPNKHRHKHIKVPANEI